MAIESVASPSLADFERQDAALNRICKAQGLVELIHSAAVSNDPPDGESLAAVAWTLRDLLGDAHGLINALGKGADHDN